MTMRKCESCGANLDPCEACDCKTEKAAADGKNIDSGTGNQSITKIPQKGGGVNA